MSSQSGSGSRTSQPSVSGEVNVAPNHSIRAADAVETPIPRSASPAAPVVSVTMAGLSSTPAGKANYAHLRTNVGSHGPEISMEGGESSTKCLPLDNPPPPPYSASPPPVSGNSDVESTRSSYAYNASSTEPTSPSLSVSVSHEGSSGDHSTISSALDFGSRTRANSLTTREHAGESSTNSGWPTVEEEPRRKSYDDGTQPISAYLHPKPSGVSALTVTRKREKRSSINPGFQLEASKLFQRPGSSRPSSPASPTAPGSSGSHIRTQSPTAQLGSRDSPRVTSPLKDYSVGIDEDSSGSTSFYSPSASPQPGQPESPTSPHRVSGSPHPQTALTSSPTAVKKNFISRFPLRSDSLRTAESSAALGSLSSSAHRNGLPAPPHNGKVYTPLALLKTQRSFDEHDGRLSPRNAKFGVEVGRRSRSVSPNPPDVPRSIESGTDTETDAGNESDGIAKSNMQRGRDTTSWSRPPEDAPLPPPKDAKNDIVVEALAFSSIQSSSEPSSAGRDGEAYFSEREREDGPSLSSVTERTSGFFIAPALPPMRFSMNGTDFRELLINLGGAAPSKRFSTMAEQRGAQLDTNAVTIPEEKNEDVAAAKTPTSVASTITPLVEADVITTTTTSNPSSKGMERIRSLKGKKAVSGPQAVHGNGESNEATSTATSPTTPSRSETKKRSSQRGSKPDSTPRLLDEASSPRSSTESQCSNSPRSMNGANGNGRWDSINSLEGASSQIPIVAMSRSSHSKQDSVELITRRLKEALSDASERAADYIKLDRAFVEAIILNLDQRREQMHDMSTKLDGMKRNSQLMIDGLSVAQNEYDQERAARHKAEAEVSRLKIELSGHAARITALSSDERRHEVQKQLSKEMSDNLTGLEQDLSKLKVERDMTLAEVEELSASKSGPALNGDAPVATVGRSLTVRLDNIKRQYQRDLVPLTQQREVLAREILELKEARDIFLEETAVLNARNEELVQLNSQYERRFESGHSRDKSLPAVQQPAQSTFVDTWKARQAPAPPIVNTTSTSSSATLIDDATESRQAKQIKPDSAELPTTQRTRFPRWPGNKASKDATSGNFPSDSSKGRKPLEHAFQQLSILRFARCDFCSDKMWGSQVRCSTCNMAVHVRCVGQVHTSCTLDGHSSSSDDHLAGPPPPSMFGRDLTEQVRDDSKTSELFVPVIVEKCIDAVETLALDYEGIYRKSGGSGQSKAITSLFERGDYAAFDLCDSDSFNDISSVTSVLKNYFRSLPNPLLTFGMHDAFVGAGCIKDPQMKGQALKDLVKQLPAEHYHTLARLMLHLHKVQSKADVNLMTARNLGVIFGPTLMRSKDPSREFADMAGKSFAIEYLIEHAPSVFPSSS